MSNIIKKISNILFSTWTMLGLFVLLGGGAAVGTFIENDYGTSTARIIVYNHIWYETVMVLIIINLLGMIYKRKLWRSKAKFLFHISFAVMLIGAGLTRYVGFEGIMHIKEGKTENRMISMEPYLQITIEEDGKKYYKEYQFDMSAWENAFEYDVKFNNKNLNIKLKDYTFAKKGQSEMGIVKVNVTLDGETTLLKLVGKRSMKGFGQAYQFKNAKVYLEYGSKTIHLPFSLKLRDFQLDRYPGSMSPSSYASEITLIDKQNNVNFDYRIYMNTTLKHGNYQFFQSSYDPDETGTILSVNNDPGKWPTYLGYFLLTLGLLMNMFDKKSRFVKLTQKIKQFNSVILIAILSLFLNTNSHAIDTNLHINKNQQYLEDYRNNSHELAQKFGKLVTQSNMGRMKPLNSLNHEILNKLSRKSSFLGMNADQVILGMMSRPEIWRNIKILKINPQDAKLKKVIGVENTRKYVAFSEIFKDNKYKLKELVESANAMPANNRGTFEKDLLKLDERLNIQYAVFYGNLFRIFPRKDSSDNSKWYNPLDAIKDFSEDNKNYIQSIISGLINNVIQGKFHQAEEYVDLIAKYQKEVGAKVIPDQSTIDNEILFNKLGIFPKVTVAYVSLGFILFIVSFLTVFNKKWSSPKVNKVIFVVLALLFAAHTFGMGMRWYISGHAPWSDTYESLVYIAWSAMFGGLFFFRRSLMALSATVVMAGIFMFTAHLSGIDPQITNLVPVLKSYWLTIHVSIITGSYGFLAIGAMLGFMSLLLFMFRNPKNKNIDETIKQITTINEAALIIGLAALIVGNFIGGVWANESWGRYWGWDPKETWAWVAIIVYSIVIHLRMVPKLNNPFVFSVASTLAFASILMTYFGVNFYLSGMHSYATGDPVPVPSWVYILTVLVFVVIGIASRKRIL